MALSAQNAEPLTAISSQDDVSMFIHKPLPDPKTHIRLLKILSFVETRDIPIHCELTTWLFADAPKYRAISYTWGDEILILPILLNGQRMDVRSNCEYALRQVNQHSRDGHIWIDAICIDQSPDNNNEKSAQVANMGQVYKTAVQVLACVGQHAEQSELLWEIMRKHERYLKSFTATLMNTQLRERHAFQDTTVLIYPRLLAWRRLHRQTAFSGLQKALDRLLRRPYFQRVWICQELFLGADIHVICGDDIVPIGWLWAMCLVRDYEIALASSTRRYWRRLCVRLWPTDTITKEVTKMLQDGATKAPQKRLDDALRLVTPMLCQDPRDRVFGTLSMVRWVREEPILPDYKQDISHLAIQVLRKLLIENNSDPKNTSFFRVIEFAIRVGKALNLLDLPSQVVDAVQSESSRASEMANIQKIETTMDKDAHHCCQYVINHLGARLSFQNGNWRFEEAIDRKSEMRIERWTDTYRTQHSKDFCQILLPSHAQNGDWILFSSSNNLDFHVGIALLARGDGSPQMELVSKALITSRSQWPKRCNKALEQTGSTFAVCLDAMDVFFLSYSCNWRIFWDVKRIEPEEGKRYFQTRLCRKRYSSYATMALAGAHTR